MTKVTETVQKVSKPVLKAGAGFVGVAGGGFVASKIPTLDVLKNIPVVGPYLAQLAPGAALIVLAYLTSTRFKNDYVEQGAIGLSIAGFLDMMRRTGLLNKINGVADTGLKGRVQNYGEYPPAYFMKSNWAGPTPGNSMKGLGNVAYNLEGFEKGAYALSGRTSAYNFMPPNKPAQKQLGNVAYSLE